MITLRTLLWAVVLVAACSSLAYACYHRKPYPRPRPPAKPPVPTPVPNPTEAPRVLFNSRFQDIKEIAKGSPLWVTASPFGKGLFSNATPGEQEIYVDTQNGDTVGPNPFKITAEGLVITATPSNNLPAVPASSVPDGSLPNGAKYKYTSGSLCTKGLVDFHPGIYAEARIRMCTGNGFWMNFQLFDESEMQEVDIAQYASKRRTSHYPTVMLNGNDQGGATIGNGTDLSQNFHLYGVEWLADSFVFYFDRQAALKVSAKITAPMFLALNLACGDTWGPDAPGKFVGPPDGSTPQVTASYVQVYDKRPF